MRRPPKPSRLRPQAASTAAALRMPQDGVDVPGPAELFQGPSGPAGAVIGDDPAERAQPPRDNERFPLLAGARADAPEQLGIAAAGAIAAPTGAPADVPGCAGDLAGAAQASAAWVAGASPASQSIDVTLNGSTASCAISPHDQSQAVAVPQPNSEKALVDESAR